MTKLLISNSSNQPRFIYTTADYNEWYTEWKFTRYVSKKWIRKVKFGKDKPKFMIWITIPLNKKSLFEYWDWLFSEPFSDYWQIYESSGKYERYFGPRILVVKSPEDVMITKLKWPEVTYKCIK